MDSPPRPSRWLHRLYGDKVSPLFFFLKTFGVLGRPLDGLWSCLWACQNWAGLMESPRREGLVFSRIKSLPGNLESTLQ